MIKRAGALIGLRRLVTAQSVISQLTRRSTRASNHIRDNTGLLEVKLRIAAGDIDAASALIEREPADPTRVSFRGELLAYRALLAAARDDFTASKQLIDESRICTKFGEPHALRALASAAIDVKQGRPDGAAQTVRELLGAEMRDPVVTAYRLCPLLLEAGLKDRALASALSETLARSHDYDLGRRAGLVIPRERRPRERLSSREREVCELLAQGRANHEIAQALYISESTAKVHVRHIFEKLGVRTRAEAVRLWVLDPDD